jgi:hypothetical protein
VVGFADGAKRELGVVDDVFLKAGVALDEEEQPIKLTGDGHQMMSRGLTSS